jgi:hypothetical protein
MHQNGMGKSYALLVVGGVADVPLAERGDDGRIEPGRSLLPLKLFGRAVCIQHPTDAPMQHRLSCPLLGRGLEHWEDLASAPPIESF